MVELRNGYKVWLRDDLISGELYGKGFTSWSGGMKKGCKVTVKGYMSDNQTFQIDESGFWYSADMIDWERTLKERAEMGKLGLTNIGVGDSVWLKSDLADGKCYGTRGWFDGMLKDCEVIVQSINLDDNTINILGEYSRYTTPMIDWDKTLKQYDKRNESNDSSKNLYPDTMKSFSFSLTTDDSDITMVLSSNKGSLIRCENSSINIKENLSQEDMINELYDVISKFI